jgi:amidase
VSDTEVSPEDVGAWVRVPGTPVHRAGKSHSPLSGLRFAAKDLFDVRGHTPSCGHPDWAATHEPARRDAPVIGRLLTSGAELIGMTVMDELAYSLAGETSHYGTPRNVNAEGRVCGGSSCGSAAATAAGLCDFALGTDTGGSIRVPASYCGIYGMRPSHGRIRLDGVMPLAPSFDTVGWFAQDVEVLARVGETLLETTVDKHVRPTRLLLAEDAFELLGNAARTHLFSAVRRASQHLLLEEESVSVCDEDLGTWFETFRRIQAREIWAAHGEWVDRHHPEFGPGVRERFVAARSLAKTQEGAEQDASLRERVVCRMRTMLSDGVVLAIPAAAGPAPEIGADADSLQKFRAHTMRLTCTAGLAGLPQISMPHAEVGGLPMGLSLIAGAGQDELLLSTALALASKRGRSDPPPTKRGRSDPPPAKRGGATRPNKSGRSDPPLEKPSK